MAKSRKIQCHYDSSLSKNVHDISTVFVRYRYESMIMTIIIIIFFFFFFFFFYLFIFFFQFYVPFKIISAHMRRANQ